MVDVEAVKQWLDSVPGASGGDDFTGQWERLAAHRAPVVTVYGAYDTGKSSLLRRLLVEAGEQVPEWVTISARHETFEVNAVEVAGCVLRDTPGFVVDGSDVRSGLNTALAADAIALTDVAIITVTPQLATAEHAALQRLLRQDWPQGALWFVITRFDEAGVDPGSDPTEYQQRVADKTAELRSALDLADTVPVFVVSQDYAQLAGSERNPNPSIWDMSRDWDGIDGLLRAVETLGASDTTELRAAAATRYWSGVVAAVVAQLRSEAVTYRGHADYSEEGHRRRASWLAQLDALRESAAADLRGRMSRAVGDALDSPNAETFAKHVGSLVEAWYETQQRNVDKLLQSVAAVSKTERESPSWHGLHDLLGSVRSGGTDAPEPEPGPSITPTLRRIANAALGALTAYDKFDRSRGTGKAGAETVLSGIVGRTGAVLPHVMDIAAIAEEIYVERAQALARDRARQQVSEALDSVGEQAMSIALDGFDAVIAAARDAIVAATAEQVELRDGLHELVVRLDELAAAGDALLVDGT